MLSPTTFISHALPRPSSRLHYHIFPRCTALPPKRIAAVAKDLQQALQTSLQSRISRISIKLPVGAKLGTESRPNDEHIIQRQRAGDRELARVLAAMFEGTGVKVRVVFENSRDRNAASKLWGDSLECEVADLVERRRKKMGRSTSGSGGGFGGAADGSHVQGNVDVYVIVGGSASFMNSVRRLTQEKGMDTLIIVANPDSEAQRMPSDLQRFLQDEFIRVYHYEPNPHPRWKGGVLFRKFPDDWVLCRLSAIGMLQKLLISKDRPTLDHIAEVLQAEGGKAGDSLLNKISTFIDRSFS